MHIKRTSSVNSMKSLQCNTLESRRTVARLSMLHRIHHSKAAIPAEKFLHPVKRQSRNLRNLACQSTLFKKTAMTPNSFSFGSSRALIMLLRIHTDNQHSMTTDVLNMPFSRVKINTLLHIYLFLLNMQTTQRKVIREHC